MSQCFKVLTIKIPIEIRTNKELDIELKKLGKDLSFARYEDGRYPLNRELFGLALSRMLKESLFEAVLAHFSDIYGDEMVIKETETAQHQTNRAYLETVEWLDKNKAKVVIDQEDWVVKVTDL